jgi:NAD(P)-dependent dehydrogenase (short-subunit alcohol dehydrogenase family)
LVRQSNYREHTTGAIRVAQALLPQMRERRGGRLLFVSSVLGRVAFPGSAAYAASTWAPEAPAEALTPETGPFGVQATGEVTPEFVAVAELDSPPLRVPVGDLAAYVLAARRSAPEDVPFTIG